MQTVSHGSHGLSAIRINRNNLKYAKNPSKVHLTGLYSVVIFHPLVFPALDFLVRGFFYFLNFRYVITVAPITATRNTNRNSVDSKMLTGALNPHASTVGGAGGSTITCCCCSPLVMIYPFSSYSAVTSPRSHPVKHKSLKPYSVLRNVMVLGLPYKRRFPRHFANPLF